MRAANSVVVMGKISEGINASENFEFTVPDRLSLGLVPQAAILIKSGPLRPCPKLNANPQKPALVDRRSSRLGYGAQLPRPPEFPGCGRRNQKGDSAHRRTIRPPDIPVSVRLR